MGRLRFILGPSGSGKSGYMYSHVIEQAIQNPQKNYILVVPEQFTMETQKKIVAMHPRGAVANIDIVSFHRFAYRVFEEQGVSRFEVLDDTGKSLILRKVIANKQKELRVYRDKVTMHGFVEEMKSIISELFMYQIDSSACQEIQEKTANPFLKEKLHDIELIYTAFQDYIREKYITKEQLLEKFEQYAEKSTLVRESELFFDGFTGFTPAQNRLMKLFMKVSRGVTVTVTVGSELKQELAEGMTKGICVAKEQELFMMSKDTIQRLLQMYGEEGGDLAQLVQESVFLDSSTDGRFRDNAELAHLEQQIFRGRRRVEKNEGSVQILHFQSSADETEHVADFIAYAVRQGMRYRDFAVIVGDMESYRKILQEQLNLRKIPYFMDSKRSLILNPAVLFLRGILELSIRDFSYESVFSLLRCGIHILEDEKVDLLENYVLACGIRGRKKYCEPFIYRKKGMTEEELGVVNQIRQELMEKVDMAANVKSGTVRSITEYLYTLLEQFGVEDYLTRMEEKFQEDGELALSKEYGQTYAYMVELFDKFVDLLGEEKISLKEYKEILDAGFEEIKVGVIPLGMDQVIVGDIERTRLGDIKTLFVLNANDGCIPKHSNKNSLLSQNDRNELKRMEIELSPTERESLFIQKFYLYLNLTKPSEQLFISYVDSDVQKKAARPSYLIREIEGLYENMEEVREDLSGRKLTSEKQAFLYLAKKLNRNHLEEMGDFEKELYTYFYRKESYEEALQVLQQGIFFGNQATNLSRSVAEKLAGEMQVKSVSRLEKYASCAYAHFLGYSLRLAEREKYQIDFADMGTLYHKSIELFSGEMVRRRYDFRTITDEKRNQLVEDCVKKVTEHYGNTILKSTSRNEYLIHKISEVCKKTVWAMCEHIKRGKYTPENFEFVFRDGRIDRLDTYEEAGKLYIKIIDYKSGRKEFDLSEVMQGLQMQLVYYMGETLKVKRAVSEGKEILPGGAFYFLIKSPYIECVEKSEDAKLAEMLLKEYKMSGLVNTQREPALAMDEVLEEEKSDSIVIHMKSTDLGKLAYKNGMNRTFFEKLVEKNEKQMEDFTEEILEGHIEKNPYKEKNPCEYCSFHAICGFDAREFENEYRRIGKIEKMSEIIKELGGEEEKDEVDG